MVPPDPMPNSAVKRISADDSVGSPHVKVGHRQAPNFFNLSFIAGVLIFIQRCKYSILL